MRNFQEFIDKKIAVSFANEKERDLFLNKCHENKLECCYGGASYFKRFDISETITMNYSGEHLLQHASSEFYEREGYEIVPASEFLTPSSPTIEIFQSKQTVVCLKKQDNKVVAVGKAKCNPEDEFDFEFGATLAYQRMIGMKPAEPMKPTFDISDYVQGIKTLKNGMKIKKQDRYEAGDKVLMKKKTKLTLLDEMKDCVGKVCTIKDPDGVELEESGGFNFLTSDIKGKVVQ